MPKREIQVISHSSATNHRILAKPDEPFPDITFQQTTAALPDLIRLNPAPGQQAAPLPLLTLLQAYGELAENKPEYVAPYLKVLGQLEKAQSDDPLVQAALGRRDLKNGDFQSAAGHLRRALESRHPVATTYADLADALSHLGQTEEALPLLDKAIELDPFNPVARKMLVVRLIETKQFAKAHDALRGVSQPVSRFALRFRSCLGETCRHPWSNAGLSPIEWQMPHVPAYQNTPANGKAIPVPHRSRSSTSENSRASHDLDLIRRDSVRQGRFFQPPFDRRGDNRYERATLAPRYEIPESERWPRMQSASSWRAPKAPRLADSLLAYRLSRREEPLLPFRAS